MISLPELQSRFHDAVLFEKPDAALMSALDAPERLEIYRNNAVQIFRQTLENTYPVIKRLVGPDCFRSLAFEYMQAYPSTSGDLHGFGERFVEYLESRYNDTAFAYLSDVAQLEWAYDAAYLAHDTVAIDTDALASIPEQHYERLVFDVNPACRFVFSDNPILAIWQANQRQSEATAAINLASGGECVAVHRSAGRVELRVIENVECLFLSLLKAGETLSAALASALEVAPNFDPVRALRRALDMQILSGWSLASSSTANSRVISEYQPNHTTNVISGEIL